MSVEAKIFISYSRRNRDFAERLFAAFKDRGYDPWVDFDDIPFSVDWWAEIKSAIDSHDIIINIVSNHSLISRVCNEEIAYARERNKRIIPLIVDDVDIKHVVGELYDQPFEMSARDNWRYVRTLNWIYFNREDDDFETRVDNIISAIETDHEHMRNHTRILTRALEWQEYDKERGFLLRGEELKEAEEWLDTSANKKPAVLDLHREYIFESREAQQEDEELFMRMRRQTQVLRRAAVGLVVTALLVIGAVVVALRQATTQSQNLQATSVAIQQESQAAQATQAAVIEQLDRQSEQAISLRLAVEAQSQWDTGDPLLLALPLGLAAYETVEEGEPPLRVQRIVSEAVYSSGLVRFLYPAETPAERTCAAPGPPNQAYTRGIAHASTVSKAVLTEGSQRVISGGLDGCVYVWDASNGALLTTIDSIDSRITSLALAPDEATFAVGDNDGNITIWTIDGEQVATLATDGHERRVIGLAYSPDGAYLFSGGLDELVILWDVGAAEPIYRLFQHASRVTAVAGDPTGLNFMSGDTEGMLIHWRFDTNGDDLLDDTFQFTRMVQVHTRALNDIAFSSDGNNALTAGLDGAVIYWTDPQRSLYETIAINTSSSPIVGLDFLNNRYGVFASEFGTVTLWDLTVPDAGLLEQFSLPVGGSVLSEMSVGASKRMATFGFDDGELLLFALESGAVEQQLSLHDFPVQNSVLQDDGTIVSREFNEDIVLWDPGTQQISRYTLDELNVERAILAPGGEKAIAYTPADDLVHMNVDTLEQTVYPADDGFINNAANKPTTVGSVFSQDGLLAMSVPFQGNAPSTLSQDEVLFRRPRILWNTETGEVLNPAIDIETLIGGVFEAVVVNGDATRFLVLHGAGQSISVFDMETLDLISTHSRPRVVTVARFGTPEFPNMIALGYEDGSVGFLSDETSDWVDLRGHDEPVFDLDLKTRDDGRLYAATSGAAQVILVWDVNASEAIREFTTRTRGGDLVRFSADGTQLITQSAEQTVVWRLDSTEELIQFARNNRFVQPLSQSECDSFQIPEPCGGGGLETAASEDAVGDA